MNPNIGLLGHSQAHFTPTTSSPVQFVSPSQLISSRPSIHQNAVVQFPAPLNISTGGPSASNLTPTLSTFWQHAVPQSMPWADAPTNHVRFTAECSTPELSHLSITQNISPEGKKTKRKCEDNNECEVPNKVFVNEEGMAAHMRGLHIGPPHKGLSTIQEIDDRLTDEMVEEEDDSPGHVRLSREVLQTIKASSREIMAKMLFDQINNNCMDIVLWKPPLDTIKQVIRDAKNNVDEDQNSSMSVQTVYDMEQDQCGAVGGISTPAFGSPSPLIASCPVDGPALSTDSFDDDMDL